MDFPSRHCGCPAVALPQTCHPWQDSHRHSLEAASWVTWEGGAIALTTGGVAETTRGGVLFVSLWEVSGRKGFHHCFDAKRPTWVKGLIICKRSCQLHRVDSSEQVWRAVGLCRTPEGSQSRLVVARRWAVFCPQRPTWVNSAIELNRRAYSDHWVTKSGVLPFGMYRDASL